MSNVLLPAEAPMELYKIAYIFYKKYNLKFCNFSFIYPNKNFYIRNNDILLGLNIDVKEKVIKLNSIEETINYLGIEDEFSFLSSIPDSVLLGFSYPDKTKTLIELFEFFKTFYNNYVKTIPINDILDKGELIKYNKFKIFTQTNSFISPEERIILFKDRSIDYVIFYSNGTVGIQKNLVKNIPLLKDENLPQNIRWFVHRRGHLILSKDSVKDISYVNVLKDYLLKFLKEELK